MIVTTVTILPGDSQWRGRSVQYYSGVWASIQGLLPEFDLMPFSAGPEGPVNPFFLTVMRRPLTKTERPMPVGVVSHSYALAPHRTVAALCHEGLAEAGIDTVALRHEVGLSDFGEWMNLRIYLPDEYAFTDAHGEKLDLRLECFNSVEGSSRLVILFGWFRFVCSNGLIIGETKIEIKERHEQGLDLGSIPARILPAMQAVKDDKARMEAWKSAFVSGEDMAEWADGRVAQGWGKKAAARVFHICRAGKDIEFDDPFAPGKATEKPVRYLGRVPGSPERATTKYDVCQAMSYVATNRRNAEERIAWQAAIPSLLKSLPPTDPA
jgi:hypothetical protein